MRFSNRLRIICFTTATLMIAGEGTYAEFVYRVTVDTTPISGQDGFIDLQFNPGIDSLSATVTIRNFSTDGVLAATSDNLGGASGTLPGPPDVTIANAAGFNDLFQGITFGHSLAFDARFTGPALNPVGSLPFFGNVFAVALVDGDTVTPLLSTSFDGVLARIDINPDGSSTATTYPDAAGVFRASAVLQAVPEPPGMWLAGIGLLCVALWKQRAATGTGGNGDVLEFLG